MSQPVVLQELENDYNLKRYPKKLSRLLTRLRCSFTKGSIFKALSNDPGKVDSNFFCYAAMVLSPHRNVLIFTQRMHRPT